MKRRLIAPTVFLVVIAAGVMAAGWWYLHWDTVSEPELAGRTEQGFLQHKGLKRGWWAYIPETPTENAPLLLLLHGSNSDGREMMAATRYRFNRLADREGFIVLHPDGFERHWNDCRESANYSANSQNIDDVGYLRALILESARRYGSSTASVYVVGISNGAQMAYRMALEAPSAVAGIAAIAAGLPVRENLACQQTGEGVATLVINGTDDPVNPYLGGVVKVFGDTSRGEVNSSVATATYWAEVAGYLSPGQHRVWPDRVPDDGTRVESIEWWADDKPAVTLISVAGGGHTIPDLQHSGPRILGKTSHEFDTAQLVWAFFSGEQLTPVTD